MRKTIPAAFRRRWKRQRLSSIDCLCDVLYYCWCAVGTCMNFRQTCYHKGDILPHDHDYFQRGGAMPHSAQLTTQSARAWLAGLQSRSASFWKYTVHHKGQVDCWAAEILDSDTMDTDCFRKTVTISQYMNKIYNYSKEYTCFSPNIFWGDAGIKLQVCLCFLMKIDLII